MICSVVVCSCPLLTGKVPLSSTPGTNVKRFSAKLEELSLASPPRSPPKLDSAGKLRVGLQRGSDHLTVEVDDRVEHGGERQAGLPLKPGTGCT